jgi:hypothetical protein
MTGKQKLDTARMQSSADAAGVGQSPGYINLPRQISQGVGHEH